MYLDDLAPVQQYAQFKVGLHGQLGIDDKAIMHCGKFYSHSISAHSPSMLEYDLDGSYNVFECEVAINDIPLDVQCNPVNFSVYADNELVAHVPQVRSHENSRRISVNIHGAKKLVLKSYVQHDDPNNWCQSIWIMPQIHTDANKNMIGALGDMRITIPNKIVQSNKCIATVVTPDFVDKLGAMLYSLKQHGNCGDVDIVVFAFGQSDKYAELESRFGITLVNCDYLSDFTYKIKTVCLSIAHVVQANKYLILDADMLILDDISNIFNMLDDMDDDKILVCREASLTAQTTLKDSLLISDSMYYGKVEDLEFLNVSDSEGNCKFCINNGVYAGTRKAILGIESATRATTPNSIYYERERLDIHCFWREQAIMNIVLAKLNSAIELNEEHNLQLHARNVDILWDGKTPIATYKGRRVKILHFNGSGRNKYPELMETYANYAQYAKVKNDDMNNKIKSLQLWYQHDAPKNIFKNENDMIEKATLLYKLVNNNTYNNALVIDNNYAFITACLSDTEMNITSLVREKEGSIQTYIDQHVDYIQGDILANLKKIYEEEHNYDIILSNNYVTPYDAYSQFLILQKYLVNGAKMIMFIPDGFNVSEYFQKIDKHKINTVHWGDFIIVDLKQS